MDFEGHCDVLVCGAGVGGVAAALECARAGLRTALVEKTTLVGGLATSGLINIYLPLCDGQGRQVTFGVAEELLHLSIKYGPGAVNPGWRRPADNRARFRTPFCPASFALALDEVLVEAGVDIRLDTLVCAAVMEGDLVAGVEVENVDGRGTLLAGCVIDATGEAVVAHRAGAACRESGNWGIMWAFQASLTAAEKAVAEKDGTFLLDRVTLTAGGGGGALAPPDGGYSGVKAEDVTRFALDARRGMLDHYKSLYSDGARRQDVYPLALPSMAQFRTTRCIVGRATMSEGEANRPAKGPIGLMADWRRPGEVWEVPYGALVPEKMRGLLAVGRCVSAEGDAWHVTRVIPCAALTGQLAGIAATLAARNGVTPDEIEASAIQEELATRGIPYRLADIKGEA